MKILQIFGAVVAVHLLAFVFIFASPGCQSGPRNIPTPDATMPDAPPSPSLYNSYSAAYNSNSNPNAAPQPVDLGTAPAPSASGQKSPTRPGSPSAVALAPTRVVEDVAPVTTYTIVKGDSLWSIAKKNHLTVAELAKANNISAGAAVRPGQKLMVPVKAAPAAAAAAPAAREAAPVAAAPAKTAAANGEGVKHTVQSGESLGVIARKYQVSVGELAAANNITDPSRVRAGQILVIPGFKAVGPKGNGATTSRTLTTPRPKPAAPAATVPAATATPPAATSTPPADPNAPHFEITAPPPGQDLDAGLKEAPTEVPTIRVEEGDAKK